MRLIEYDSKRLVDAMEQLEEAVGRAADELDDARSLTNPQLAEAKRLELAEESLLQAIGSIGRARQFVDINERVKARRES